MAIRAYLGLGANLGDVERTIEAAIAKVEIPAHTRVLDRARLYRSRPVGPAGQPDYLNTAIAIETTKSPTELLSHAKAIEAELGRVPSVRWGPRAIDVDILIYGDLVLASEPLTIPHAELAHRRFVLAPLSDLAPDLIVPGLGRSVQQLLTALEDDPASVTVAHAARPRP